MSASNHSSYSPHAVPTRAAFSSATTGKNLELAMLRDDYDRFVAVNGRTPGDTLWSLSSGSDLRGSSGHTPARRSDPTES